MAWNGTRMHEVLERLMHCDYWPGMKKDVQLQFAPSTNCDKFYNPSKRHRAILNPISTNDRGDVLALDVFAGKDSLPGTPPANA